MKEKNLAERLLDTYSETLVAPAIVEAEGVDVQRYTQDLRVAVARHMRHEQGASVTTIARHLGVSGRWVSKVTKGGPPSEPLRGWYVAIMDVMTEVYPQVVSVEEVQQLLIDRKNRHLGLGGIVAHLELYCDFGKLVKVGEKYQASSDGQSRLGSDPGMSLGKIGERLRILDPLCKSVARGEQGAAFGQIKGQMDSGCLAQAVVEIQQATEEILRRQSDNSRELLASGEAKLVDYGGLILIGPLPKGRGQGEKE